LISPSHIIRCTSANAKVPVISAGGREIRVAGHRSLGAPLLGRALLRPAA
jgi:hypothetical protein